MTLYELGDLILNDSHVRVLQRIAAGEGEEAEKARGVLAELVELPEDVPVAPYGAWRTRAGRRKSERMRRKR